MKDIISIISLAMAVYSALVLYTSASATNPMYDHIGLLIFSLAVFVASVSCKSTNPYSMYK